MVSDTLLAAGFLLLVIGAVFMLVGKVPAKKERKSLYKSETVHLAPAGDDLSSRRYIFSITLPSQLHFEQASTSGIFETYLFEVPIAPSPDRGGPWMFSHEGIGNQTTTVYDRDMEPGTFAIGFANARGSVAGTTFNLRLEWKVPVAAWAGEVGVNLFVVAIPVIVTGLLT